jgi:monoamine oxidase
MARTFAFSQLARAMRVAWFCAARGLPARDGLAHVRALEGRRARPGSSRRQFLGSAGRLALGAVAASAAGPARRRASARPSAARSPRVAIVGAGLAGLACADVLGQHGVPATVIEASARVGGRCWSLPGFFPGQVAERGGEFIDTLHKTMLGYVQEFDLTVEDVAKMPGEVYYFFDGQRLPEAAVVEEFRALVPAMRTDLRASSGAPTAAAHNDADVALDRLSLREYLERRGAGRIVTKAVDAAYVAEYGREIDEQSALNFLLFIHADRRAKFTPFGVFSDERFHVLEGNDRIAAGIAARLPGEVVLETRVVRVRKDAAGRLELTTLRGRRTQTAAYDAVVLAIPFTVLREEVELDASLGLPPEKRRAIDELGYGDNAKTMVGFDGRPWLGLAPPCDGTAYSDLANHQTTWETNPTRATGAHAILTDYAGGRRGASLNPARVRVEVARFLVDLDRVFPGAAALASRDARGDVRAVLEHWPSNPLARGSYTCYTPGQFTTIAGHEGTRVGPLHFAGEHANSFYEWQGFMEGALLSGMDAAWAILQDVKAGAR